MWGNDCRWLYIIRKEQSYSVLHVRYFFSFVALVIFYAHHVIIKTNFIKKKQKKLTIYVEFIFRNTVSAFIMDSLV